MTTNDISNVLLVSLGPNCHTAGIIKYLNYKKSSYPFDWILSNIEFTISSIENDFEDFKNKSNYIYSSKDLLTILINNKKYLDETFVHREPIKNEEDFLYYLRCIDRFTNLKHNSNLKIFIYTTYDHQCNNNIFIENVHKLNSMLDKKSYKFYNILIINYINNSDEKMVNQYDYKINNNIIYLNINIKYIPNDFKQKDESIFNFYKKHNPIEEIVRII